MSDSLVLTQRDEQIIQSLCAKVRLMTLTQIADYWWAKNKRRNDDARRRLSSLVDAGFLKRSTALAARLPPMVKPVLSWSPGDEEPNLGAVAWQLQSRWTSGPCIVTVYLATTKATRIFGGKARGYLKQEYQATHDLGVSQMFLNLRQRSPDLARAWIGEDILAPYRRRQKLPDAVIASSPEATPTVVLEFGGAYDKPRVQSFHNDCRNRGTPYELW